MFYPGNWLPYAIISTNQQHYKLCIQYPSIWDNFWWCFREFSKERGKAAARGEYQKNKAKNQIDEDMKVQNIQHTP